MTDREFAAIIGETKETVLSAVRRHLAARFVYAVDDVVQETYLRAYRSLAAGRFKGESAMGTWLYAIARNESLRMNERLEREERKLLKMKEKARIPGGSRDRDADIGDLYDAIERLPDKYRSVLERLAHGMPVCDIARELAIEAGTVKSRASRGREMLCRMMKEEGYEPE